MTTEPVSTRELAETLLATLRDVNRAEEPSFRLDVYVPVRRALTAVVESMFNQPQWLAHRNANTVVRNALTNGTSIDWEIDAI